jgi:hypothetical protein
MLTVPSLLLLLLRDVEGGEGDRQHNDMNTERQKRNGFRTYDS